MNQNDRNELITENVRLAYYFAHRWKRKAYWMDLDELMSAAQYGLTKAANTFDDTLEIKFSTYAGKCIENEILILMRSIKNRIFTISLETSLNTSDEYWGDKDTTVEDMISMDNNPIEEWTTNHVLLQCLERLTEKEKMLIYKAYMEDVKEADLAKLFKVQQPQINRMKKQALEKMRKVIKDL